MNWKNVFDAAGDNTTVTVEIILNTPADMDVILKMGFEQGFTAGLNNLEAYLSR